MMTEMAVKQQSAQINGLDMDALVGTLEAVKHEPSLGRFEFRATNRWIAGGENRSRIKEFYGAGSEDNSRTEAFEFINGEPP
ncbi:MAG: OsmC family peroxiredoxin, partial [Actinomycetia bacterium]|nr:OsmC family peroxiredoxin [Actinomycetes bacterium]